MIDIGERPRNEGRCETRAEILRRARAGDRADARLVARIDRARAAVVDKIGLMT